MITEKCLLENLAHIEYFDLYKNLKSNLENYLKNSKNKVDNINNFGYYCLNCQVSFCNDFNFVSHEDHVYIKKALYEMEPEVINNVFRKLQVELESNEMLNPQEKKNQMIHNLNDQVNAIQIKLEDYKEKKIEEINHLFDSITSIRENLCSNIYETKFSIQNFFSKNKKFFNCDKYNHDRENTVFLIIFELLNSCCRKNNDLAGVMSKLEDNANIFEINLNKKLEEIKRLLENSYHLESESSENQLSFDQILKGFSDLEKDHYIEIKFKINKYNEHIDNFKNLTYENIVRSGGITDLESLIRVYDKKNKNKTTIVLEDFADNKISANYNSQSDIKDVKNLSDLAVSRFVNQLDEEKGNQGDKPEFTEENKFSHTVTNFIMTSPVKAHNRGNSQNLTATAPSKKHKKNLVKSALNVNDINHMPVIESNTPVNFKNKEEVTLENRVIQRYFAYQTLDLVNKYFRIKDKNIRAGTSFFYIPVKEMEIVLEDEVCKPLIGTNEIQIYERKKRMIIKKKVVLNKAIHGYTKFLDGVRWYLHNDKLYIIGGRDEIQDYKIVLSYDLKTYTLRRLGDMLTGRSYHTIHYNELFKTIMVIGGQNNSTCELYDIKINKWRMIPSLNHPRANVSVHYDDIENNIYAFFGIEGDISRKKGDYSYIVEVLKLKNIKLGWIRIDYNNKSDLILKQVYLEIFPLPYDKILIYGGKNLRNNTKKQFALYLLNKHEIVKIDNKIMDDLRLRAKKSPRLSRILTHL